jgi:tetratricopeptide (TPR) repeat protein/GT2 family glycosyltransferase
LRPGSAVWFDGVVDVAAPTLRQLIEAASNDYAALEHVWRDQTGGELLDPPGAVLDPPPLTRSASVLIGAHDARSTLPQALVAIERSSLNRRHPQLLEVIVVDDGSTDGTFDAVRALDVDLRLRCIRQEQAGLTAAHNTALAFAGGDIVIFSDADVIHTPFALEQMMIRHECLGPVVLIGFRFDVDAADERLRPDRLSGALAEVRPSFWHDFRLSFAGHPASMCRATNDLRALGHGRTVRMCNGAHYNLAAMVVGAFFSLPRADYEQMGGSEERLIGWGCEDSLIGARAIGLGRHVVPVYAAASAHVSHPTRDTGQSAQFASNIRTTQRILDEPFRPPGGFDRALAHARVVASFETVPRGDRRERRLELDGYPAAADDHAWWWGCYEALGHWDRALDAAVRWEVAEPGLPAPLRARGRVLRRAADPDGARAALEEALRLDPGDALALYELGLAEAAAGAPSAGRERLRRAREQAPWWFEPEWVLETSADDHKRRGNHHAAQGLHAAAVDDFDLALLGDDESPWTHHDRGASLLALGRAQEAERALRCADALLHPDDGNRAWLHAALGEALLAQGRRGPAKVELGRALRRDPANAHARTAASRLEDAARAAHAIGAPIALAPRVDGVAGWLTAEEIDVLSAVTARAAAGSGPRRIVELGSYCGRSTLVMAHTIRATGAVGARVHAIDPHAGYELAYGLDTYAALLGNLAEHRVDDLVEVVRARSREVAWEDTIALLFIDALHDEEEVRADFATWSPRVAPDGFVAFHDYFEYCPGVQACVDDQLSGGWDLVAHGGTLIVIARTGADSA